MSTQRIALALTLCFATIGCAQPATDAYETPGSSPASSVTNDPKLESSAGSIIPELETRFKETYSGVEMRHADHTMVIYRLPDAQLDEFVRTRIPDVTVVFRDGRLSLARMRDITDQITRDREQWQAQGITINGAGPTPDGSTVEVLTDQGTQDEERALNARYGEDTISVRKDRPVHPTLILPTGSRYTPPSGP